ncbi:MAG: hypothetical protein ACLQPD_09885 [Desulfomonilaceae bacterium]
MPLERGVPGLIGQRWPIEAFSRLPLSLPGKSRTEEFPVRMLEEGFSPFKVCNFVSDEALHG